MAGDKPFSFPMRSVVEISAIILVALGALQAKQKSRQRQEDD